MLDLFTVVWSAVPPFRGLDKFYCDITLPCLMLPLNIPSTREFITSYNIYTDEQSQTIIGGNLLFQKMVQIVPVNFFPLQKGVGDVNSNILHQMRLSASRNNHMFIILPDAAYGDSSILNIAKLCQKYDVVFSAMPKMPPATMEEVKAVLQRGEVLTNRKLVTIQVRNTAVGPYNPEVKEHPMHHSVPNPCPRPDQKLIEFYSTNDTPNQGYDHALPMWMIENGYSWYYIDNSDVFFAGDVAEPWLGSSGPWGIEYLSRTGPFFANHIIRLRCQ